MENQKWAKMEAHEEERTVIEFGEEDGNVTVQADSFNDKLTSVHFFTLKKFNIKNKFHDEERSEIVDGWKSDKGNPDI